MGFPEEVKNENVPYLLYLSVKNASLQTLAALALRSPRLRQGGSKKFLGRRTWTEIVTFHRSS